MAAVVPLLPPGEQVIATTSETDVPWLSLEVRMKAQNTLWVLMITVNPLTLLLRNMVA